MRTLRPYQQQAVDAVFEAEARGVRCQAIVMATGLGKTVVFAHLIARRGGRALVLAHRDELLTQAAQKIQAVHPDVTIGIVRGGLDECNAQIVVASVATLSRERRLKRLKPDFSTVIVDEAHHSAANSYGKIFEHVAASNPLLIGVTATPDRADGKGLDQWFSEIVFEMGIDEGIRQGWLSNLEGKLIHLKGADFSKVHVRKGDYDLSELEQIMEAANWHEHVAKAWADHASERKAVIFVPKVAMAHALAQEIRNVGGRAEAIDGAMSIDDRRGVLNRLNTGETRVVVNCAVLTEGFDEPSLDCVIMARPTKSRSLYVQCVGRGLRLHEGKENCLILDMVGVSQRHDLVSLASLAGVERLKNGESFTKAQERSKEEAEQKAKEEAEEKARIEAEHEARRIDLLNWQNKLNEPSKPKKIFFWQGSPFDEIETLFIKGRTITVRPMAGGSTWIASDGDKFRCVKLTVEQCKAAAEAHAKTLLFGDENAAWKKKPASEKQKAMLAKFRIQFNDGITSGEASALIDARFKRFKQRENASE